MQHKAETLEEGPAENSLLIITSLSWRRNISLILLKTWFYYRLEQFQPMNTTTKARWCVEESRQRKVALYALVGWNLDLSL